MVLNNVYGKLIFFVKLGIKQCLWKDNVFCLTKFNRIYVKIKGI